MSKINIVSLGGVQETGKNLYIVEVDSDIFILDAGMKYPPSDVYGVDVVLPDISYLISNSKRIKGIFLTHAHDDHIGTIPHILKYMRIPVYASPFTLAVVKELLQEHNLNPNNYELIAVSEKVTLRFGYMSVRFINVSHSVPQSFAIVINTPDGNIIYTGNYNFDQNGKALYRTNVEGLCKVASEGVLALLPESISTINEINRGSISEFVQRLKKIFTNANGRIVISLFSTNLQRIQQLIDIAVEHKKKIAIIGRKTQRIVNIAINSGYLKVDPDRLINLRYIDDKNKNNQSDLVVLVTGERHEPYFMLQRMAKHIDRLIHLEPTDTIVVLTRPAIGTEKMAARTLDMLFRETDNVIIFPTNLILSASSGAEEAKQMINLTRPKFVIPVVETTAEYIKQQIKKWQVQPTLVPADKRYDIYKQTYIAIVASGTVSAELAMLHVPTIVVYKMNAITSWLIRQVIQIRWVSLVNILLKRTVFPEMLGADATAENIVNEFQHLTIPSNRKKMTDALKSADQLWLKQDTDAAQLIANSITDSVK